MRKQEKFIKPAQFAEQQIIQAIINDEWKAGEKLPPERELAQILGITRPTLRETLQRLARDGWISITHGKPSTVNDYKNTGGLGVLKSLVNVSQIIPHSLICDWLEFRILIFPELTEKAVDENKAEIINYLSDLPDMNTAVKDFALFDWQLQIKIVHASNNSIAKMLYNDLSQIYLNESIRYFDFDPSKKASILYYKQLRKAILEGNEIKETVKLAMKESYKLWKNIIHK
ncbi:MAG: GntR family transcriptional regulator [Bacteroidales bacterium]|nr:GntR family transcriptional regulator [Bacteroidales bacterium]